MRFPHRKLLECEILCLEEPSCPSGKLCDNCTKHCYYLPPPPPPPSLNHTTNHNISTYLIISFSIASSVFIILCCYAIYVKFFSSSSTNNRSRRIRAFLTRQQTEDDDFVVNNVDDDDDDDVVDHPIWYIRTPGLQQSIISAITVCKYKKGEGLIDGTDCSVCLSEFEDGESLRLLPKCNHAFHLPCIDTWLASHTNCPMCRAPIVIDPLRVPSMNPNNVFGSNSVESVRIDVLETGIETETSGIGIGIEDSVDVSQLRNGEEEQDGIRVSEGESSGLELVNMQPRRSVSLDSSSAAKINLALSAVLSSVDSQQVGEVDEQVVSKSVDGNGDLEILNSAPSSMKRSRSFNAKHLLLPRHSSSQKKSNGPVRSF